MKIKNINDLFHLKMKAIYDVEDEIIKSLPALIENATNPDLKQALEDHLEETRGQKERVEEIFNLLGAKSAKERVEAIRGMANDAEWLTTQDTLPEILDVGLISSARAVEHYEIALYTSAISLAEQIADEEIIALLEKNLGEEQDADDKLDMLMDDCLATIAEEEAEEDVGEEDTEPPVDEEE